MSVDKIQTELLDVKMDEELKRYISEISLSLAIIKLQLIALAVIGFAIVVKL